MMNQEALQVIIDKTHALMNAHSCCKEAKAAAQAWLDAIGTENEAEAAKKYVEELEADIMPVDQLSLLPVRIRALKCLGQSRQSKLQRTPLKSKRQERSIAIARPAPRQKPSWKRRRSS